MTALPEPAPPKANASVASSLSEIRKLRNVLQGVDFFTRLKLEELETLLEHLKKRSVPRGTLIIQQGDKNADAFYMVASGRCSVWKKKGTSMEKVADLGPETYFGERALITDDPRAATIRAEEPTELYVLYRDDFKNLLLRNPSIAQELKFHVGQYRR
jgi:CRP-like cAMP-binding protein